MSYYYITREKWNRTMVQRSCAYQSRESSRVIVIVAVISIKYEGFNVCVCVWFDDFNEGRDNGSELGGKALRFSI